MSEVLDLDALLDYWEGQCQCCEYGLKCHECVQIHDDFLPVIRQLVAEITAFREHLTSDATVERVARALFEYDGEEADPILGMTFTRERYRNAARAALAAALASEGEARNGAA